MVRASRLAIHTLLTRIPVNDRDVPPEMLGSIPVPENALPPLDAEAMGMPVQRPTAPAPVPAAVPAAAPVAAPAVEAAGEPRREPASRRRNEAPVLVIEAESGPSRGLEATVEELQKRLRATESQLRLRDEALIRMKVQGTPVPAAPRAPAPPPAVEPPSGESPFFGAIISSRRQEPDKVQAVPVEMAEPRVRARPPAALPGGRAQGLSGPGGCPFCSSKLQKAKCLNVRTLVCLSCRGVYLDMKAVHQLAKTQTWFRFVERFLNSPRNAAGARKSKGQGPKSAAR
jgi:Zn-finger nucleic acid-binding protein